MRAQGGLSSFAIFANSAASISVFHCLAAIPLAAAAEHLWLKTSPRCNNLRRLQRHRPKQARIQQLRILCIMMPRRKGEASRRAGLPIEHPLRPVCELFAMPLAVGRQLFIANQAVRPQIGDFDDQLIHPRFCRFGDVYAEWRFPQHAVIAAIQGNFGEFLDLA